MRRAPATLGMSTPAHRLHPLYAPFPAFFAYFPLKKLPLLHTGRFRSFGCGDACRTSPPAPAPWNGHRWRRLGRTRLAVLGFARRRRNTNRGLEDVRKLVSDCLAAVIHPAVSAQCRSWRGEGIGDSVEGRGEVCLSLRAGILKERHCRTPKPILHPGS